MKKNNKKIIIGVIIGIIITILVGVCIYLVVKNVSNKQDIKKRVKELENKGYVEINIDDLGINFKTNDIIENTGSYILLDISSYCDELQFSCDNLTINLENGIAYFSFGDNKIVIPVKNVAKIYIDNPSNQIVHDVNMFLFTTEGKLYSLISPDIQTFSYYEKDTNNYNYIKGISQKFKLINSDIIEICDFSTFNFANYLFLRDKNNNRYIYDSNKELLINKTPIKRVLTKNEINDTFSTEDYNVYNHHIIFIFENEEEYSLTYSD